MSTRCDVRAICRAAELAGPAALVCARSIGELLLLTSP